MTAAPAPHSFSAEDRRRMAAAGLPSFDFSVEDYHRLADIGVLTWNVRDVELLDGQIYDIMPPGPLHANSVRRFNSFFAQLGGDRWLVDVQNPVRLNNRSQPEPDFALLRPLAEEYELRHPAPEDVFLLVEVSDSSVRFDQGRKLAAYAKAGIREYWIVNLVARVLEVHRRPLPTGSYESVVTLQGEDAIALEAFPEIVVSAAQLLRAEGPGGSRPAKPTE